MVSTVINESSRTTLTYAVHSTALLGKHRQLNFQRMFIRTKRSCLFYYSSSVSSPSVPREKWRSFHFQFSASRNEKSPTVQVHKAISYGKENKKIYARVNNFYRKKRAYWRTGYTEDDPGALHLYSHQNLKEG